MDLEVSSSPEELEDEEEATPNAVVGVQPEVSQEQSPSIVVARVLANWQ